SVDMVAADAPERIRHWIGRGLSGLRVFIAGHTTAHDARLDDPRSFPAWQCAADAGIPVCVQVRAGGLAQLETLLERFPAVRAIGQRCRARVDLLALGEEPLSRLSRYLPASLSGAMAVLSLPPMRFTAASTKSATPSESSRLMPATRSLARPSEKLMKAMK